MENNNNDFTNTTISSAPVKKSKAPIIAGCAVGGVAVAGIAAACIFKFVPSANNWLALKTQEPEEYFANVEKEYFEENATKVGDSFKKAAAVYESSAVSFDFENFELPETATTIAVGATMDADTLIDAINSVEEGAIDTSSEDATMMMTMLSSFESIELSGDVISNGKGLLQTTAKLGLNDSTVLDADVIIDTKDYSVYVAVPTLSKTYLKYTIPEEDVNELKESLNNEDVQAEYAEILAMQEEMVTALSDNMTAILTTYSNLIIDSVKDVEIDEKGELTIAGNDFKVTEMTATITADDAMGIMKEILEEAKNDENIIEVVEQADVDKEAYAEMIDEALASLEDADAGEGECELVSWATKKGELIGHKLVFESEGEKVEMGYAVIEDKNTYASTWITADDGEITLDLATEGKNNENGTITFKVDVEETDLTVTAQYTDYKVVDEEKGLVNFNAKITTDYSELEDYALTLKSECEDNSCKMTVGFEYKDKEAFSYYVMAKENSKTSVELPKDVIDLSNATTSADIEAAVLSYAKTINIVGLKENLTKAIDNATINALIDTAFESSGLGIYDGNQSEEEAQQLVLLLMNSMVADDSFGEGYYEDDINYDDEYTYDDSEYTYDEDDFSYEYVEPDYDNDYNYDSTISSIDISAE